MKVQIGSYIYRYIGSQQYQRHRVIALADRNRVVVKGEWFPLFVRGYYVLEESDYVLEEETDLSKTLASG